jgi:hypothetical protein
VRSRKRVLPEPVSLHFTHCRVEVDLVSGESYLAMHAAGVFRVSFLGFGPTELRIVLAIGVLQAA